MLWLPYQAYTLLIRPRNPSQSHPDSPLGDASLLLLLALVFHAPPLEASYGNPFRQSLQRLQDADDQGERTRLDEHEDLPQELHGVIANTCHLHGCQIC